MRRGPENTFPDGRRSPKHTDRHGRPERCRGDCPSPHARACRHQWKQAELQAAVRVAVLAILAQGLHFVEEFATGFHEHFPELLGLTPWSLRFFVSFNLFWLAIWSLSVWGLAARKRAALFPFWFLGIGCVANGLAHPLFSIITRGYFPGLVTSLVAGIVGVVLLRWLLRVTDDHSPVGTVRA